MPNIAPRRPAATLSSAQQDYVKAIYLLAQPGRPVATSELAARMKIRPASVTGMLAKLAALGLVNHDRYRGTSLTAAGESLALEMIRHHRLLETYLVVALGYGWDEVHEEAERLEHHISERLEARIFDALGRPRFDPHGDPIPSPSGSVPKLALRSLRDCRTGDAVTVRRVSDRDSAKLKALDQLGVAIGSRIDVVAESRWEGPIEVRVGRRRLQVPLGLAGAVFVEDAGGRR
ncbi:MAG: metal-dependent transcriptional regulator [Candidatus Dormiibacterota bacterium]